VLLRLVRPARGHPGLTSSRRRSLLASIAALGFTLASSCRRGPKAGERAQLSWSFSPDPPRIGPAVLSLRLTDARARPVSGARWSLEGHMMHPGRRPVVAEVTAGANGLYEARLAFSMAGDWVIVARAEWAEGGRLQQSIPVRVAP
jgi:YtkA-like protein